MIDVGPPTRWITFPFEDDDMVFYVEVGFANGEDGWPIRQVELEGPGLVPIAAAALAEWPDTNDSRNAYVDRYGACGDQPLPNDFPVEDITAEEFEAVWTDARARMDRG